MTAPMRRYLLNKQIAIESRRIAHTATKTCKIAFDGTSGHDDEHTKNCNALKREIETLGDDCEARRAAVAGSGR